LEAKDGNYDYKLNDNTVAINKDNLLDEIWDKNQDKYKE
jgi:hypothetical protein